jgi:hypothetical protein
MERHAALCGYTQSDEMTLIIPPASVIRGVQQAHERSGRVLKIATLAAATVTAVFNARVQVICASHVPPIILDDKDLPLFDCRIGRTLSSITPVLTSPAQLPLLFRRARYHFSITRRAFPQPRGEPSLVALACC